MTKEHPSSPWDMNEVCLDKTPAGEPTSVSVFAERAGVCDTPSDFWVDDVETFDNPLCP